LDCLFRFSCVVDVPANTAGAIRRVNEYEGYQTACVSVHVCACMCIYMCVCMHGSEWLMGGDGLIGWVGADCGAIQQGDFVCCSENSG
jgi:hypothetical protein